MEERIAVGRVLTRPTFFREGIRAAMKAKPKKAPKSENRHVRAVRGLLAAYATRGVLREFEEHPARGGKVEFRFTWLLDRRFRLIFDSEAGALTLKDLLPGVPAKSRIEEAVSEIVAGRTDKKLPVHRRVDPAKAVVTLQNRKGALSLTMTVKRSQYAYAVPKLLNFCNELFGHLDMYHVQYLWEHMGLPEE